MIIGLNVIGFRAGAWGGVETYFKNIFHYLQRIDKINKYLLLCDRNNSTEFPITNHAFMLQQYDLARPSLPWFARAVLRRALGIDLLKPVLNGLKLDVIHHPFTVLNPRGLNTPSVLTFWDMQQEFYPQFFSPFELRLRKKTYEPSAKEATRIIVSSEFTKQCLVERYKILSEKIDVIYIGYGPEYGIIDDFDALRKVKSKYNLTRPFLYFPAATWPHKNHKTLLSALKLLKDKHSFDGLLVLTGIAKKAQNEILEEIARLGLTEMVRILGYLSYDELPYLYNLARMMVFPSLFEGFGIPLVEAMACGCPVLCSNVTSIPEVVGNAGVMFDPLSSEDMAQKIWAVWNDDRRLAELRALGTEQVKKFNWEETARKTVGVYEKVSAG